MGFVVVFLLVFAFVFVFGGLATPLRAAAQRDKVVQPLLAWAVAPFFPLQAEDPAPLNSISGK